MDPILHRLRRFRDEEDGLVMAEFLLLLPLLIWAFLGLFIFWDAFRTLNEAQKATYAVADLISRQNDVPLSFVNGMDNVMEMMITNSPNVKVRITSIEWDRDDNRHYVLFSRSPGSEMPSLTTADMVSMRNKIPVMNDHDSVVIVQTETEYDPLFDVGILPQTFRNLVVTRPRFYRRICLVEQPCPATM